MFSRTTLNLIGIKELWFEKKIIQPKLIIFFENLSNDGLILLNNMLRSIGLSIDKERIKLVEKLTADTILIKSEYKIIFLTSHKISFQNQENVFICPHPDEIIENTNLKKNSWEVLVSLRKLFDEIN